ncbi:MAG TPA: 1-deoxy-D-xylulose-5-phosphate reductoisomerase [candidate division WOR-3 bacterium]|uniref:1-deoxy-D-xylulose 5-phosphate reductoisomerase n=1 Tax=candidate division WOR-3 bacterium TaxID=2052148 RepID=A0A7V0Q5T6_UNCW3|nr:1-deoxy-D-xylulose-5-phosphate reductoisomerase [candidate division WOR-3 bacterium]
MKKINIALLGASGSIGQNTLEVLRFHKDRFNLIAVSVHRNIKKLEEIIQEFKPRYAVITSEVNYSKKDIKILRGIDGLKEVAALPDVDTVVVATAGTVGVFPTINALRSGKRVALANKETLVSFGGIVKKIESESSGEIIPVDSEHSAIFQLFTRFEREEIQDIVLTASGGAFRNLSREDMKRVTMEDALKHPTWSMGKKITVDSATLMNKGLEVIEAYWLFSMDLEHIKVVIHPQSIVHGMLTLKDGAIVAHLSIPDMKIPIQYALTYPERIESPVKNLDLTEIKKFEFYEPDYNRFPLLKLAYDVLKDGGTMPAVMNASNEIAVYAFLDGKIGFLDIERVVFQTVEKHKIIYNPSLHDLLEADKWAREYANHLIQEISKEKN